MTLDIERQATLTSLLNELSGVTGVVAVQQDDHDSASVNVFLTLDVESCSGCMTSSTRPYRFVVPIRSTKAGIRRECKAHDVSFNFLDWPKKKYISDGGGGRLDDGYNHEEIKIEVFV